MRPPVQQRCIVNMLKFNFFRSHLQMVDKDLVQINFSGPVVFIIEDHFKADLVPWIMLNVILQYLYKIATLLISRYAQGIKLSNSVFLLWSIPYSLLQITTLYIRGKNVSPKERIVIVTCYWKFMYSLMTTNRMKTVNLRRSFEDIIIVWFSKAVMFLVLLTASLS